MRISKLRLNNFKCFRGETILELESKVYAIVASRNGDQESSNWAGKSSLLESVDFALHGRLPKSVRTEDSWITRGEKMGEVELVFDTGERIVRSRTIGKSTKVYFWDASGANSMQAEAQAHITRLVGLSLEDFLATCYFEQKGLAKIVLSEPSRRMEMVAGWFRLGPIQECEEMVRTKLNELLKANDFAVAQASTHSDNFKSYTARLGMEQEADHVEFFQSEILKIREVIDSVQFDMEALREKQREIDIREQLFSSAKRYEHIVLEGTELKGQLDLKKQTKLENDIKEATEDERKLLSEKGIVERDIRTRLEIVENRFNGECPLVKAPCPSRSFVEGQRDKQVQALQIARNELKEVFEKLKTVSNSKTSLQEQHRDLDRVSVRLDSLRQEARQLKPSHERYSQLSEINEAPTGEYEKLRADYAALVERRALLDSSRSIVESSKKASVEWEAKHLALEKEIGTAREAMIIFGKNGAQRRIAETALSEIEFGSNEMLKYCDIPLSLEVQWSREGTGVASNCAYCGSPFPKSEKIKKCSRCDSERGPNLINKLDVVLSDRSGAAEDLAGGAIQLAASAWLRNDRVSGWSVAMIDEPFGALDASNRRAFASHLVAMLQGDYGFSQAFIVSHTADTQNMTNARIEITNDGKQSTAKVVG